MGQRPKAAELPPDPSSPSSRSRPARVLWTALVVTLVSTLPVFLTGSLAVEVQPDLGFDTAALGLAITGFFLLSAVTSIAVGRLADRRGWAFAMRTAAAISSVAMIGMGTLANSWGGFAFFLAIGGLSMAVGHPAVNLALATEISKDRQGLVFGVKHSAVPAAALLSGLALPLFALTVGWRAVFIGGGVLAALVTLAPPSSGPRRETGDRPERGEGVIDFRPLLVLAVGAVLAASGASALSAFMVVSVVNSGIAPGTAGLMLALASVGGLVMRLAAGWWADSRSAGGLGGVAVLLVIGSIGFSMLAGEHAWVLAVGAIIGFGAGWGWNGLFNFAVVKHHPAAPARATSIALTGMYAGAAAGPAFFGFVADRVSFDAAWFVTACLMLGGAVVMLIARSLINEPSAP